MSTAAQTSCPLCAKSVYLDYINEHIDGGCSSHLHGTRLPPAANARRTTQPVVCPHFSAGGCRYGAACVFRHVAPQSSSTKPHGNVQASCATTSTVVQPDKAPKSRGRKCQYFAKGGCRKGSACKFSHENIPVKMATGRETPPSSVKSDTNTNKPCKYFAKSGCRQGKACKFSHEKNRDRMAKRGQRPAGQLPKKAQTPPPNKKACQYHAHGGCKRGKACKLSHETPQAATLAQEKATQVVVSASDNPVSERLREADSQRAQVSASDKPVSERPRAADSQRARRMRLAQLSAQEISLLRRLYGSMFKVISARPPVELLLSFVPSEREKLLEGSSNDDDTDSSIEALLLELIPPVVMLHFRMPPTYPEAACQVELLNEELDPDLTDKIYRGLEERASALAGGVAVVKTLRWLDDNMLKIVCPEEYAKRVERKVAALQVVRFSDQAASKKGPKERKFADDLDAPLGRAVVRKARSSSGWSSGRSSGAGSSGSGRDSTVVLGTSDGRQTGTELRAVGFELSGLASVQPSAVKLVLSCDRCQLRTTLTLRPSTPPLIPCGRCDQEFCVGIRPSIAHELSSVLGYLDVGNCSLNDVLLIDLIASCLECGEVQPGSAFKAIMRAERAVTSNCRTCHAKLSVVIRGFKFVVHRQSERVQHKLTVSATARQEAKMRDRSAAGMIVPGQPLPKNGACKHYKRSHRWFRFPCCGKAYPCDVCHEDDFANAEHGDEIKLANRNICGFCAFEGSIMMQCSQCGKELADSAAGKRFWEGGSGQRSRHSLARGDPRKTRGLSKTVSRKQQEQAAKGKGKGKKKK